MWIQVKSMDGKTCCRIDGLSKLTKVEDLRKRLVEKFEAPESQQRLFYRGKQLEDGHTLFDYSVGLNDIIQILVRQAAASSDLKSTATSSSSSLNKANQENEIPESSGNKKSLSQYFKVGDKIDARDPFTQAWFEAKILGIRAADCKDKPLSRSKGNDCNSGAVAEKGTHNDDGLVYKVAFDSYEEEEAPHNLRLCDLRPRASTRIKLSNLQIGDNVMVNYNIEEPNETGFWYDCIVTNIKHREKKITATLLTGNSKLENQTIPIVDKIFGIEKRIPSSATEPYIIVEDEIPEEELPEGVHKCERCKDNPSRKCKECSCYECGGKDDPGKQIMCDECNRAIHLWCLSPPLEAIPEEDWYCPNCKNDESEVVRAGEKLKESKKKSKMPSASSSSSRDWGRGMACVGRTTECTIVPPNHFGPIPGVEVGSLWKFRLQVSESGIHRPPVSGIHGRESEGAYSIVLSGGYEDDVDDGEEFTYTGSGGRDLSGNKRVAEQSCDQTLTRMNKALALNCDVPLNKEGATARDWVKGKPVRVVRNCKGRKHSKFCPQEGNRYDGIYKIVKYWPDKGKSGFVVWRYLLRRDDEIPAPWTKEGEKRSKTLGLTLQFPSGFLESREEKEKKGASEVGNKRTKGASEDDRKPKKRKTLYSIPADVKVMIERDDVNKKLWQECSEATAEGSQVFLKKVEDSFLCICCQELVFHPITTSCLHNICKSCLERSFKAEVFNCPMCRQQLDKGCVKELNETLQDVLLALFPGYGAGR